MAQSQMEAFIRKRKEVRRMFEYHWVRCGDDWTFCDGICSECQAFNTRCMKATDTNDPDSRTLDT